jgi:hypothetical protein
VSALILAALLQATSPAAAANDAYYRLRSRGDEWTISAAELDRYVKGAAASHAWYRGLVNLPPWPKGEVVVRMLSHSGGARSTTSTVAARTAAGWRVETVIESEWSRELRGYPNSLPSAGLRTRVSMLSPETAAKLDALLASPALYADAARANSCLGGLSAIIEIVTPTRRAGANHDCQMQGPTNDLVQLLLN